ncbi:hypothetical protein GCM10011575_41660 [Microlunatus endophyticus]|uniref:Uncharacterized protein n=1 Tax=Microlunatus endophyticus TaxID=1716077 RepID=A0A917SHI3_9ACTN|nr:hypothetical protein [Microlunatus endophyticus]GGL78970.1 hypothetical protein GCM10011575_41660 [Microlunatus endophyticus]
MTDDRATDDLGQDDSLVVAELERLFETLPAGTSYTDPRQDLFRAKKHVRGKRWRVAAAVVSVVAAVVLAIQLVPGRVGYQDAHVAAPVPANPRAGASRQYDGSGGVCDDGGYLQGRYPNFYWVATGIRSALGARLDPTNTHLEDPGTRLTCMYPPEPDQQQVQEILTWTTSSGHGVIIVNVANFDSRTLSACGTDWICTPAPTSERDTESAQITRTAPASTDSKSFGVLVTRDDGQHIGIQAYYAANTDDAGDPIRPVKQFPFDSNDLLKVAVDPRVNLNREAPKHR